MCRIGNIYVWLGWFLIGFVKLRGRMLSIVLGFMVWIVLLIILLVFFLFWKDEFFWSLLIVLVIFKRIGYDC